ncbi:hypothetical protein HCN44_009023 [Aphidius gifuensis]|uniref:Venom protein n=1 Tax=Aphidius gifuensis TaxID=684658 RepID=A0A835CRD2_APHGI|nr:hypothetical protein HCN44_009023 [Aphidius gifuensis]
MNQLLALFILSCLVISSAVKGELIIDAESSLNEIIINLKANVNESISSVNYEFVNAEAKLIGIRKKALGDVQTGDRNFPIINKANDNLKLNTTICLNNQHNVYSAQVWQNILHDCFNSVLDDLKAQEIYTRNEGVMLLINLDELSSTCFDEKIQQNNYVDTCRDKVKSQIIEKLKKYQVSLNLMRSKIASSKNITINCVEKNLKSSSSASIESQMCIERSWYYFTKSL